MSGISIGTGLFVYNRPKQTHIVLESLQKNPISKLYVFADGPEGKQSTQEIEETRRLVRAIDWCQIEIVEHTENLGTVGNVIFGLRHMFALHDAAIVLEDDCEVRPDYYFFMASCLDFYKDVPGIFHVNGYQLPIRLNGPKLGDIYFSPLAMSWGFGIWKRSWTYFRLGVDDSKEYFQTPAARRLLDVVPDFAWRMKSQLEGRVNSLTYRWNFIISKNEGLCVSPYHSFVRNIGWDAKGVHCGRSRRYDVPPEDWQRPRITLPEEVRLPQELVRDPYMDKQTRRFYRKKPEILMRAYEQWKSLWRKA